jgi:hypothetical protein
VSALHNPDDDPFEKPDMNVKTLNIVQCNFILVSNIFHPEYFVLKYYNPYFK